MRHAGGPHAQQLAQTAATQLTGVQFFQDGAAFKHGHAVGHIQHQIQVLFHDDQGQAKFIPEFGQGGANLLHDRWLDAFTGFIQQQQPRFGHQSPGQGQDLLLSPRQRSAFAVEQHPQARKLIHHALDRLFFGFTNVFAPSHAQVFQGRQAGQDAAPLRHITNPHLGPLVGGRAGGIRSVEFDAPTGGRHQAHDDFEQGGFAHAVVADDANRFAFVDLQIDAMQHRHTPVASA